MIEMPLDPVDWTSARAQWLMEEVQYRVVGPIKPYFICSTARSGSTMLGVLLWQCNAFGRPDEYLHLQSALPYLARCFGVYKNGRLDDIEYLKRVSRSCATPNGVFGVKTHWTDFAPFYNSGSLAEVFPNAQFFYLWRKDLLAQAISWTIALQRQMFHVVRDEQGRTHISGDPKLRREVEYDREEIERHMGWLLKEQMGWKKMFAMNGIEPISICYEDLMADPHGVCTGMLRAMGVTVDHTFTTETLPTRKMTTNRNKEWADRYMSEPRGWNNPLNPHFPAPGMLPHLQV